MKKGSSFVVYGFVCILLVLFAGCVQTNADTEKETFSCNPPFRQIGSRCCLDQNNNYACDSDEGAEKEPEIKVQPEPVTEPDPVCPDVDYSGIIGKTVDWIPPAAFEHPFSSLEKIKTPGHFNTFGSNSKGFMDKLILSPGWSWKSDTNNCLNRQEYSENTEIYYCELEASSSWGDKVEIYLGVELSDHSEEQYTEDGEWGTARIKSVTEVTCEQKEKNACEEMTDSFKFKQYIYGCKDYQILKCKKLTSLDSDLCFAFMAINYKDENICEYVSKQQNPDVYWYCSAITNRESKNCANIESIDLLKSCLENT